MPNVVDYGTSFFAFNPGAGGEVIVPMLQDSRMEKDPAAVDAMLAANGIQEPLARWQGLCQPVALIRTHLFIGAGGWFGAALLRMALGAADSTGSFGTNRPAGGLLPSLGSARWKYGDEDPEQWTACKMERMVIEWGAVGSAPVATLLVMPYGETVAVGSQSPLTTTAPYGVIPAAQNIAYGGTLDAVSGGVMTFQNVLEPVATTPSDPDPNDGNFYPSDYSADPLRFAVSVEQTHAATQIPAPTFSAPAPLKVIFRDADNLNPVTFDMRVTPPAKNGTIRFTQARTVRNYKSGRGASRPSLEVY